MPAPPTPATSGPGTCSSSTTARRTPSSACSCHRTAPSSDRSTGGSIGYSVGALLGTLTAAPDRRHLLFLGDGSFQLTAQELSTILRHDRKPVIFLINNGGYTIERGYLGRTEQYNDIATWAYADLPRVLRPDTTARSFVVKTPADLAEALSAPNDTLIFIEAVMDPYDAPVAVMTSSDTGADIDYGPRGPQHRDNVQLRPA
ncbi:thiamine pyrophosphate-dependent enzyme [Streptomyces sp. NPDC055966]|uniref:thiamine pyrophosphate-dependent enzyme n=1 Tax=Streptomyces sp. NPDC055966 TaxID=3345669 RepID=UPI0035E2E9BE